MRCLDSSCPCNDEDPTIEEPMTTNPPAKGAPRTDYCSLCQQGLHDDCAARKGLPCGCPCDIDVTKPATFEEALDQKYAQMKAVMLPKRKQRGTANITEQGLQGVVTRMGRDKLSRILRMVADLDLRDRMKKRGIPQEVIDQYVPLAEDNKQGDGLRDDLLDTAAYAFIAVTLMDGEWQLP